MDLNSVLSGIVIFLVSMLFGATVKRWKVQDRKTELYRHKVDALVFAISSIGTSIGEHFRRAYDDKLGELINESNFKNERT